jgi:G3E family GTPase
MQPGPDAAMSMVIHPVEASSTATIMEAAERVFPFFAYRPMTVAVDEPDLAIDAHLHVLISDRQDQAFALFIEKTGFYALLTQHHPSEFTASLTNSAGLSLTASHEVEFNPGHEHDQSVTSVAFEFPGSLDLRKFESWLNFFLQTNGQDIFRMKGIVAIKGEPNRFIFQGVHMLFDAKEGQPWAEQAPFNRMVFIGRNLDKLLIESAFRSCF